MVAAPFARIAVLAVALCVVAVASRAASDPWRPWVTAETWGRRLQHPDAAVRRATLWALSLREAPGGGGSARLIAQVGAQIGRAHV